jgi:hypothetical protein
LSTNYRSQPQKEETEPKEADLKLLSAIYYFTNLPSKHLWQKTTTLLQ